jgi:hypothetical protein
MGMGVRAVTPEGRIKREVDRLLERMQSVNLAAPDVWWFKPVQSGFGKRALDYVGCFKGRFFAIETKAPGEELTRFQKLTAFSMCMSGAAVWIISEIETIDRLEDWMWKQ